MELKKMADELALLVLSGKKTETCAVLCMYEKEQEKYPEVD